MGNSNSTHSPQTPLQWSQSLDPPDSRNRMKKGYFPPRHYISHANGGMVPPQKVLPTVNPAKEALRLKPTSNGAILHKGGTISGRKLQQLSELELSSSAEPSESLQRAIRKRHLSSSSVVNGGGPGDPDFDLTCGRSTPNLASMEFAQTGGSGGGGGNFARRSQRSISGHTINFDKGSMKGGSGSGRDYDSEPDMRDGVDECITCVGDSPDRSVSPLPNSFTLISESPAKKQIRTKKKYQAPPPPMASHPSPDYPVNYNGFDLHDPRFGIMNTSHRGSSMMSSHSHDSSSGGGGGGKKKLQRLFKTKAQSKLSGNNAKVMQQQQQQQLQQHQSSNSSPHTSGQRVILAESILPSSPSHMHIPHARTGSSNSYNSSSHLSSNNNHNQVHMMIMGMTTTTSTSSSTEEKQLEKLHQSSSTHHHSTGSSNMMSESEGRRVSSNEIALAAAAAVANKKYNNNNNSTSTTNFPSNNKKPFTPLCSTKEDHGDENKGDKLSAAIKAPAPSVPQVISGLQSSATTSNPIHQKESRNNNNNNNSNSNSNNKNLKSSSHHAMSSITSNLTSTTSSSNNITKTSSSSTSNHMSNHLSNPKAHSANNATLADDQDDNGGPARKTFYFGMDMGNSMVQEVAPTQKSNTTSTSPSNNNTNNNKNPVSSTSQRLEQLASFIAQHETSSAGHAPKAKSSAATAEVSKQSSRSKNNTTGEGIPERSESQNSKNNNKNSHQSIEELAYKVSQRSHMRQQQPPQLSHDDELSKVMQHRSTVNSSSKVHSNNNSNSSHKKSNQQEKQSQLLPPQHPQQMKSPVVSNNHTKVNKHLGVSQRSDSDSDGFHNLNSRSRSHTNRVQQGGPSKKPSNHLRGDSSSDLSSSEVDIPLLIRPTLPQKRLDLPRFSPSAAWRALDSPRASGRSLSSEDGFSYEDRIQRYTRPIAPTRANNERSGDSGISAGDAGSPANAPGDIGRNSSCSLSIENSKKSSMNNNFKSKIRKGLGDDGKKDGITKCWTPEQDLDESSSEFEHDVDLPRNGSPGSSDDQIRRGSNGIGNPYVPPGLQTPPKLTTRSQLFSKNSNNGFHDNDSGNHSNKYRNTNGFIHDDSDQVSGNNRQHLYARSTKANKGVPPQSHSSIVEITNNDTDSAREIYRDRVNGNISSSSNNNKGSSSSSKLRQQNPNSSSSLKGFVGLDTNWFLSRSEPNSLNVLELMEVGEGGGGNKPPKSQPKLSVMPTEQLDLLDKVFPRGRAAATRKDQYLDEDDEDQPFTAEDEDSALIMGNGEVRSEIGYGPSSMNFYTPSHPSQSPFYDEDCSKANSLIFFRRPFSHIMYLPSYDSRRLQQSSSSYYANNRRTKSVDNLDADNKLYLPANNALDSFDEEDHRDRDYSRPQKPAVTRQRYSRADQQRNDCSSPFIRSQSVPLYHHTNNASSGKVGGKQPKIIEHKIQLANSDAEDTTNANNNNNNNNKNKNKNQQQSGPTKEQQEAEQKRQEIINKKKKFKFQSTLRVMERKKIEAQLSREAEEMERQRLQEQEALRKVEEEFQRKRAQRENNEIEVQIATKNKGKSNEQTERWDDVHLKSPNKNSNNNGGISDFDDRAFLKTGSQVNKVTNGISNGRHTPPQNNQSHGSSSHLSSSSSSRYKNSRLSSTSSVTTASPTPANHVSSDKMSSSKLHLTQRQEPEGAPAFSTTTDLRKELIHASRKRNGSQPPSNHSNGHHGSGQNNSELTRELSEYRQETRQYCDYRRSPARNSSASPARFMESASSDIFPISRRTPVEKGKQSRYRSTVHPEVVCDIPVKPFPFMVNFSSRLSGSASNLVMEDRPGSGLGLGGGNTSGPSSVISDNYRRDWAHHIRGSGGSTHGGPGRASSIASLHSAPGYTSDHFRHSSTDLTIHGDSPRAPHKSTKSPLFHKYSNSPPPSPLPPLSSNVSEFTDPDKDGSSIITSTNGGGSSGVFQVQPFNKPKGYRPVSFRPSSSNHAIKLTSTVVK